MEKKGISLIILVITIIVIIILSGSIISNLTINNTIIKGNESVFKTNAQSYDYELTAAITYQYSQNPLLNLNDFDASTWGGPGYSTDGTIKQYIENITEEDAKKFEIQNSKLVYVGDIETEKNYIVEIGLTNKLPLGIGAIAANNSTVNGLIASYSNPIIPKGFMAVNDGNIWPQDYNKGLVIEDEIGNQFVWVPVDGTNVVYEKNYSYQSDYVGTSLNTLDDTLPDGVVENWQITKYGGFYIARYEAGNEAGTLVSKKGKTVWVNITYIDSRIKATSMYNKAEVKSGLVTGTQWDTTLDWLEYSGTSIAANSITWGNYTDSLSPADVIGYGNLQVSGFSEYWKANNIYDLAGNSHEWSNEIHNSKRISRGGSCLSNGGVHMAGYRCDCKEPTTTGTHTTFRTVLYIM